MIEKGVKVPDTRDAEKWVDADTFIYKGGIYRLNPDFKVVKVCETSCRILKRNA